MRLYYSVLDNITLYYIMPRFAVPCPCLAVPCLAPALPCPLACPCRDLVLPLPLPCLDLPCLALPCPCPALPIAFPCLALPCPCLVLPCLAVPCPLRALALLAETDIKVTLSKTILRQGSPKPFQANSKPSALAMGVLT